MELIPLLIMFFRSVATCTVCNSGLAILWCRRVCRAPVNITVFFRFFLLFYYPVSASVSPILTGSFFCVICAQFLLFFNRLTLFFIYFSTLITAWSGRHCFSFLFLHSSRFVFQNYFHFSFSKLNKQTGLLLHYL